MIEVKTVVNFEEGLHARPASELVKVCQKIKADIVIKKENSNVNPKSILGILSLGASYNDALTIEVDGVDEVEGAKLLSEFFE